MDFEIFENENLQNININYEFFIIKSKYPLKWLTKTLTQHQKTFINFTVLCNYYFEFKNIDNNETEIVSISIPAKYDKKTK